MNIPVADTFVQSTSALATIPVNPEPSPTNVPVKDDPLPINTPVKEVIEDEYGIHELLFHI